MYRFSDYEESLILYWMTLVHYIYCGLGNVMVALQLLLAHLSQRLKGELIGFSWSGVHTSSSSTVLKDLLLRNRGDNQSQNSCGASLGRLSESLLSASWSHDQDGRHDHIW